MKHDGDSQRGCDRGCFRRMCSADLISLEGDRKGARNIFAHLNPFRDDIAEPSEIARHLRVDPHLSRHPGGLQPFGIRDALIHQGIILGQDDQCRERGRSG